VTASPRVGWWQIDTRLPGAPHAGIAQQRGITIAQYHSQQYQTLPVQQDIRRTVPPFATGPYALWLIFRQAQSIRFHRRQVIRRSLERRDFRFKPPSGTSRRAIALFMRWRAPEKQEL
jgi:hypothetical protein